MARTLYIETHIAGKRLIELKIFNQQIENNIAFNLISRNYSAAAYGVLGDIDIRMYSCAIMPTHPHMTRVQSKTYCRNTVC